MIRDLRKALLELKPTPEDDGVFSNAIDTVTQWLWQLNLVPRNHRLIHRVTDLESHSILGSLTPLVESPEVLLPLFQAGTGTAALLGLLLPLLPAVSAMETKQRFIVIVDEPELHLHPGFHGVIADLIRGLPHQSIIVTHSPHAARSIPAEDIVVIQRSLEGKLHAEPLVPRSTGTSERVVRVLYHKSRDELLSAILGQAVVVPEGETDSMWLTRVASLARLYQSAGSLPPNTAPVLAAVEVLPTPNSQVTQVCQELLRLGSRILPIIDGDEGGTSKLDDLGKVGVGRVVQWPTRWGIESVIAWICQPALTSNDAQQFLCRTLARSVDSVKALREALIALKNDWALISSFLFNLITSVGDSPHDVIRRAYALWHDLSALALGTSPHDKLLLQWSTDQLPTLTVLRPAISYAP